jgi:hypothetical protein
MTKLALTFIAGIVVGAGGVVGPSVHATAADSATVEIVAEGLEYPTNIAVPQDGSGRIFVLSHHGGTARVIKDGALQPGEFLNVKDRIDEALRARKDCSRLRSRRVSPTSAMSTRPTPRRAT